MPVKSRSSLWNAVRIAACAWSLVLLALLGCKGDTRQPGAPIAPVTPLPGANAPASPPPRPALRVLAIADLSGYLEPCGCQSRPLGGIDKAAQRMKELAVDGVPSVLVAAGDLFFEPANTGAHGASESVSDAEAKTEQLWRAETLASALKGLGLAAASGGPADLRYGAEVRAKLDAQAGGVLLDGTRMIERAGVRVGVWGAVAGDRDAQALLALAAQHTAALRKAGAQIVIALVNAEARIARRIAGGTPGLDFVVVAGAREAKVVPPEKVGDATLLHAGRHGHGLLAIDVFLRGAGALQDASAWTRSESDRGLQTRIEELEAKLAAWRKDTATDPKLLAEQEQRLARMRAERNQGAPEVPAQGNAFSARFLELGPEVKDEPQMRALLAAHDKRVNDHNRVALAHLVAPKVPKGDPTYAGSEKCGKCHESELAWWRGHAHGRAYETLVKANKQFSLSCVGCHVTGYGKAGGATITHNAGLVDVGCESCHGPGSMHIADLDSDEAKNVHRHVAEAICAQCHTPEHSDLFEYDEYKKRLIVPGHGLPLAKGAE